MHSPESILNKETDPDKEPLYRCQACDSALKPGLWPEGTPFVFHGPVLICTKCSRLYFQRTHLFFHEDGELSPKYPDSELLAKLRSASKGGIEQLAKEMANSHRFEDAWVTVAGSREADTDTETIIIQIGKERLTDHTALFLFDISRLMCAWLRSGNKIFVQLSFFDRDYDYAVENPRFRKWCHDLWLQYSELPGFLNMESLVRFATMVSIEMPENMISTTIKRHQGSFAGVTDSVSERLAIFYARTHSALKMKLIEQSKVFNDVQFSEWIKNFRNQMEDIQDVLLQPKKHDWITSIIQTESQSRSDIHNPFYF